MWPYWLTLVAYLVAAAGTSVAATRWPQWAGIIGIIGLALIGLVLLLPATCRSLPMPMCDEEGDCDPSGDSCSTLAGLTVPYADAFGVWGTRGVGVALIAAGIALATIMRRRR